MEQTNHKLRVERPRNTDDIGREAQSKATLTMETQVETQTTQQKQGRSQDLSTQGRRDNRTQVGAISAITQEGKLYRKWGIRPSKQNRKQ